MGDGWRLAVGMLTVVRVAPPRGVDRDVARTAMLLAPLAVLPLGLAVLVVGALGHAAGLPALVIGFLCVGTLVLGNRAFHVDGLSDTADGLTASYDRDRSLDVMRTGTSGPAGGAAVLLVLGLQAAGFASIVASTKGAVLAGALVCASRCALLLTCAAGVPGARSDGLGSEYAGSVPRLAAVLGWASVTALTAGLVVWAGGDWWRPLIAVGAAVAVVVVLVRRAVHRLGGVTGDVYGAAIELCLAALLVALA
ncbi:adenosylcobinamide-GDP ribazoletransferase [Nocardioides sp. LHG3406-4]|uniref:adenosylcobinamide-GDP ribazoletransferase n=1 Tax=Nocardioides sp. LHG3406-4 TaxID=2804575 RepID=UPI003CF148C7